MSTLQAYRFELDPNDGCRSALASHAGAARFAFNWGRGLIAGLLSARRGLEVLALRQGASAVDARAWAADTTGPVPWSLGALRRAWNRATDEVAPWWPVNSKEAYNTGLDRLCRALRGFFDSRSGARRGPRAGWPKFNKRGGRRSFTVTTGSFGVIDSRHIRLPRIGLVRTKEPTVKLSAKLDTGRARILSATVSERAGRWWVSFCCQVDRPEIAAPTGGVVGVDLGVAHLAALSTGEVVANPKHLSRWQRRQARWQAELSRRRGPTNQQPPSRRWVHTKARLAKTHLKVTQARVDGLHKLTTRLATTHAVVVIEDLAVKNMTAAGTGRGKAGLNRAILDVAPAQLRRQLAYKTGWYHSKLVVADRWYPSSKTCSACQTVKTKLSLAERVFRCDNCGLVIHRDLNAAHNLAALPDAAIAHAGTASGAGTGRSITPANAQGEAKYMDPSRCASTNCEDSTAPADQTATAIEQSTAA
jgi:putative transposase